MIKQQNHGQKNTQRVAGLTIASLLISWAYLGCSSTHSTPLPSTGPSYATPTPAPILTQAQILQAIRQNADALVSLKATGEMVFIDANGKEEEKCQILLLIKGKDKVLLKGFQALIPHFFTISLLGDNFSYYLPREDVIFQGKRAALEQSSHYDIMLRPSVILNALVPLYFEVGKIVEIEKGERHAVLTEKRNEEGNEILERRIRFDSFLRAPDKIELFNFRKTVTANIELSNFSVSSMIRYPQKIRVNLPETNEQIYLRLNRLLFNPEISDSIFDIQVPKSVKREKITSPE